MQNQDFGGSTYRPGRDRRRLTSQLSRVLEIMSDNEWHTLPELSQLVNGTEASVSARIRDLRKAHNGSHTVERAVDPVPENGSMGLWRYRIPKRKHCVDPTLFGSEQAYD